MSTKEKCQSGCMIFTGGEIKHDENCVFYPESLTKFYADLRKENEDLVASLINLESRFKEMAESAKKSYEYLDKAGMECSSQCSMAMNTAYLLCAYKIEELLNKTK